jgi:hypothetical protein
METKVLLALRSITPCLQRCRGYSHPSIATKTVGIPIPNPTPMAIWSERLGVAEDDDPGISED